MTNYDVCLTWCWKYDADFIRLLESACRSLELSCLKISPDTLGSILPALESGEVTFGAYLDRTEHEAPYEPVFRWAREHGSFRINPKEMADWAEDKAIMHFELIKAGIATPYTIILPSCNEQPTLPAIDLTPLGEHFVIKPCYGGGGQGVLLQATSIDQVRRKRTEYPHLKYLLQKTISPQKLDGRDAWFRVVFCAGQYYSCWWDPTTHIYGVVSAEEEARFGLFSLSEITGRIADLCKLGFFSTEIALSLEHQWVVIDYVNDQIDMRLQSQAMDGVPDSIVEKICFDLASLVKRKTK